MRMQHLHSTIRVLGRRCVRRPPGPSLQPQGPYKGSSDIGTLSWVGSGVVLLVMPFSWAGKLFVFTARKPLLPCPSLGFQPPPQHFAFTTRTFLLPCPSLGIQPYPQLFIFSKDSPMVGRSLPVYCGFSPYIAVKTIPVLGGRSLRVQGIHNILLPLGLQRLSGADGFYGACCHI